MTTRFLALACLTVLAVTACKPDTPEPAAGLPAAETAAPVATDVTPVREDLSSDHSSFDMKGFAGTFSGTLPCDSCPGIDTTVVLNPDGTYRINEVHQQSDTPDASMDGTWTVEADDRQIRLVMSADAPPGELYQGKRGTEAFEFQRTASRLMEMQSKDWLDAWTARHSRKNSRPEG